MMRLSTVLYSKEKKEEMDILFSRRYSVKDLYHLSYSFSGRLRRNVVKNHWYFLR